MTEGELLARVTKHAEDLGLFWHHCPDSRRCHGDKGLPDLMIAGTRGFIAAELKGDHGQTSAEQDAWIWRLFRAGIVTAVWHPEHWRAGTIQAWLEKIA